jgi:K+-transporting ATPase ATPase C chain
MKSFITALKIFLVFTVLTGIIYPVIVTGIAQAAFPVKANGSLIMAGNTAIGSELIGQKFDSAIYFSSRPSAIFYNPLPSGGSNYGLTNSKLKTLVSERRKQFLAFNRLDSLSDIPSEMLFASASGLDPHTSPEAALMQVDRITTARNFNFSQKQTIIGIINELTEKPQLSLLGERRINILVLNMRINKLEKDILQTGKKQKL